MKTVFEIEMDVRWGDMDAFNHVNNASYLRFIEEARVLWFKQISPDWSDPDCAPILAAAQMNYRRPIGWPQRLRIVMFAERIGGKSLTLAHRIESASEAGVLYADGNTVLVWVDRSGASLSLPGFVRAAAGADA
jgi:acyl-CoA thioester hydrolase